MARVAFLADLHLSPTHGFFWDNFARGCDAVAEAGVDATVVNGDLCINGPESDAEMAFASRALRRLPGHVLALPGNHDVGDEPPGQDPAQIVDAPRLARWDRAFGADRFAMDAGNWRLLGVNAQLFGSGLAREAEQGAWLSAQLTLTHERPVALVLHKPLFLESEEEDAPTAATLNPAPRRALLALLREAGVRMVISGHLHAARDRVVGGIRHLWLPALAFRGAGGHGGRPAVGATVMDFGGEEAVAMPLRVDGLVAHDLDAIKGHGRYRFLRDMPECPPPGA